MKIPTILTAIILYPFAAYCEEPTLDSLTLKGAPAMTLSGSAPTEIARPTGAQQLGLSILGGTAGANFGFETKPFWWSDHEISDKFYEKDWGWNVIQQTFSLSGARYEVENATGTDVAEISFGVAFDLVRGGASEKYMEARQRLGESMKTPTELESTDPEDLRRREKERLQTSIDHAALDQMFEEMVKGRVGWNVSFAAASSYQFEDTDYNGGEFAQNGAWFVTSYTPDNRSDQFTYMGLVRYLNDQGDTKDDVYIDVGARILWSLDKFPLSISGEYIKRFADKSNDSERLAALLEYQINDTMSVFASHGLTFDQTAQKDEVFTALGMSFGLGKTPQSKK